MVYLNVFYLDIEMFLFVKKENVDEKICVKMLFFGVIVLDKFYELICNNEDMYLFSFYSVECEYGVFYFYVDIIKEYDNLVVNLNICKCKIKVCDLENEIFKL